jgi:predicted secreted protein
MQPRHLPLALALCCLPLSGHTDEQRYNQVHFSVSARAQVDNDRMQAILYIQEEDSDPARLANTLNSSMDWALKTAKMESTATVKSGAYQTYPVYTGNRQTAWRARQDLHIESGDFAALSKLIGTLQTRMQIQAIGFTVSDARRTGTEEQLITEALAAFQQRAELIRNNLKAKDWRLVDLNVQPDGGMPPVPMMMHAEAAMAVKSVAEPALEAGSSTLSVSAGGTIELEQ